MDWLIIAAFLCSISAGIIIGASVAYPLGKRAERRKLEPRICRHINIHSGGSEDNTFITACRVGDRRVFLMQLHPNFGNRQRRN